METKDIELNVDNFSDINDQNVYSLLKKQMNMMRHNRLLPKKIWNKEISDQMNEHIDRCFSITSSLASLYISFPIGFLASGFIKNFLVNISNLSETSTIIRYCEISVISAVIFVNCIFSINSNRLVVNDIFEIRLNNLFSRLMFLVGAAIPSVAVYNIIKTSINTEFPLWLAGWRSLFPSNAVSIISAVLISIQNFRGLCGFISPHLPNEFLEEKKLRLLEQINSLVSEEKQRSDELLKLASKGKMFGSEQLGVRYGYRMAIALCMAPVALSSLAQGFAGWQQGKILIKSSPATEIVSALFGVFGGGCDGLLMSTCFPLLMEFIFYRKGWYTSTLPGVENGTQLNPNRIGVILCCLLGAITSMNNMGIMEKFNILPNINPFIFALIMGSISFTPFYSVEIYKTIKKWYLRLYSSLWGMPTDKLIAKKYGCDWDEILAKNAKLISQATEKQLDDSVFIELNLIYQNLIAQKNQKPNTNFYHLFTANITEKIDGSELMTTKYTWTRWDYFGAPVLICSNYSALLYLKTGGRFFDTIPWLQQLTAISCVTSNMALNTVIAFLAFYSIKAFLSALTSLYRLFKKGWYWETVKSGLWVIANLILFIPGLFPSHFLSYEGKITFDYLITMAGFGLLSQNMAEDFFTFMLNVLGMFIPSDNEINQLDDKTPCGQLLQAFDNNRFLYKKFCTQVIQTYKKIARLFAIDTSNEQQIRNSDPAWKEELTALIDKFAPLIKHQQPKKLLRAAYKEITKGYPLCTANEVSLGAIASRALTTIFAVPATITIGITAYQGAKELNLLGSFGVWGGTISFTICFATLACKTNFTVWSTIVNAIRTRCTNISPGQILAGIGALLLGGLSGASVAYLARNVAGSSITWVLERIYEGLGENPQNLQSLTNFLINANVWLGFIGSSVTNSFYIPEVAKQLLSVTPVVFKGIRGDLYTLFGKCTSKCRKKHYVQLEEDDSNKESSNDISVIVTQSDN